MDIQINEQAAMTLIKQRKNRKKYLLIAAGVALLTVIGVVIALIQSGRAYSDMKLTIECTAQVHTHSAECYDENGNLICGLADYVAHTHNESCYNEDGELICSLPEIIPHVHDESCYIERLVLVCGMEEGDGASDIVEPTLPDTIDGVEPDTEVEPSEVPAEEVPAEEVPAEEVPAEVSEPTVHHHSEECYETVNTLTCEVAEHTHTEECYEAVETLTCEIVEHTHTDECKDADGNIICGLEEHTHSEECYVKESSLICEITEHTHSEKCYTSEQNLICGMEEGQEVEVIAEEPTALLDASVVSESDAEEVTGHVHTSECYVIVKELVCTEQTLHTHTAECYDENGNRICGLLQLEEHVHGEECFRYEEEDVVTYTQEAVTGNYKVTAVYDSNAGIPADAVLCATEIVEGTDEYEAYKQQMRDATGDQREEVVFLIDIYFTSGGVKIEPTEAVNITIQMLDAEDYQAGEDLDIIHFMDDGNSEVINNTPVNENGETNFSANSFSIYAGSRGYEGVAESQSVTITKGQYAGYTITISYGADAKISKEKGDVLTVTSAEDSTAKSAIIDAWRNQGNENRYANIDFLIGVSFINNSQVIRPSDKVYITIEMPASTGLTDSANSQWIYGARMFGVQANNQVNVSWLSNEYKNLKITSECWFPEGESFYIGGWYKLTSGVYGGKTITFRYDENPYTTYSSPYYKPSNELGIVGNFGLVAFNRVKIPSHANLNILAKEAELSSNWGTNQVDQELSYVQKLISIHNGSEGGGSAQGHMLVIGNLDGDPVIGIQDNGNKISINGVTMESGNSSASYYVIETDTQNHPFIDLDAEETAVKNKQISWASTNNINITLNTNTKTFTLTENGSAGYITVTADELESLGKFTVDGFDISKNGSMIITVNCYGKDTVTLPDNIWTKYKDANGVIQTAGYGETGDFSYGKVIYNFVNIDPNNGTITDADVTIYTKNMIGMVIAPEADIYIKGNTCGTVIGDNVYVDGGEPHRTDFTGTLEPLSLKITANKYVDGEKLANLSGVKFELTGINVPNGIGDGNVDIKYRAVTEVKNGVVDFGELKFGVCNSNNYKNVTRTYYYQIKEIPTESSYVFDDSIYIVEFVVKYDENGQPTIQSKKYYKVNDNTNYLTSPSNKKDNNMMDTTVDKRYLDEVDENGIVYSSANMSFHNSSFTTIPVEKEWKNYDDSELTQYPYSITYTLYRTDDSTITVNDLTDAYAINAYTVVYDAQNPEFTWNYVFSTDADGNKLAYSNSDGVPYKYYVKETQIVLKNGDASYDVLDGYIVTYDHDALYVGGTTQKITNKKKLEEYTKIEVDKDFFFNSVDSSNLIKNPGVGSVTFNIYQIYTTANGDTNRDNASLYDTITITNENNWVYTRDDLIYKNYALINGSYQETTYTYYVTEVSCNVVDGNGKTVIFTPENATPDYSSYNVTDGYVFVLKNVLNEYVSVQIGKTWWTRNSTSENPDDSLMTASDTNVAIEFVLKQNGTQIGKYDLGYGDCNIDGTTVYTINMAKDANAVVIPWSAKITNLPKYYFEDGAIKEYVYTIEETRIINTDSYEQYGDVVMEEVTDSDGKVVGYTFKLKNHLIQKFSLPETGGIGLYVVYAAGAMLLLGGALLLVYKRRKRA